MRSSWNNYYSGRMRRNRNYCCWSKKMRSN
jgi:hypothetical protein